MAQQMLLGAAPLDMPPGLDNAGFVNTLYRNLGSVDNVRLQGHINDLQFKTRGQVAVEILSETLSATSSDLAVANRQTLLANKTAVGLTYALTMKGDSADVARTLFAQVTADNAAAGIHAALSTSPAVYARSQVASLFIMMFGIEADLKGFDYWSERVPAVTAPLAERVAFVQNIISGDTEHRLEPYKLVDNRDFVKYIYSNAFGQLPDAAGLAHWVKQLDTQSRAEVITAILYDVQNSAGSSSIDAATQLQFRLNQKAFAEKTSLALNHLAVLEQNKLASTGSADQQILNELRSAASVAAGLAIEADLAALQAMGDIGRKTLIQKAADISWVPTLNINNGSNGTPVAPVGHNSIIQTSDRWGNVLSATDVRDPKLQTSYHYDSDNRLIETTRVDGAKITEAYNSLGQRIGGMDANGYISYNVLDASGHVLEEHRADGHVARQDYNGFGERTSYTDATGYQTTFKYDAMGRVSSQTQTGAVKVYQSTDLTKDGGVFNPESVVPQQLSISYQYDELGRRIQTTDAAGGILRSWYDLRGNVIKADNESHTASSNGTQTTSRFDALNHKVNETDAIGGQKNWEYDIATGRLASKTDLGGHKTLYAYNYYNQVVHEYGEGAYKKDVRTSYNQLGQVLTIQDVGTTTNTYYQYDAAGNRLTESVIQVRNTHIEVLQDNHLSYDKLGRLSQVETGRYGLKYLYDNNGNRTMVDSYYVTDIIGTDGKVVKSEEHQKITWNSYDAMNRQLVADGVNVNGVISTFSGLGHQGHEFRYDAEGRRISDTSYGKKITSTKANVFGIPVVMSGVTMGDVVETYGYDAIGRLDTVKRDGVEIDKRYYNANSQLIRSGISDSLIGQIRGDDNLKKAFQEAGVNDDFTIYKYQADKLNQVEFQQVHTTAVGLGYSGTAFHYDAAGRLERYTQDNSTTVKYDYKNKDQFDQYQVSSISGNRGGGDASTFNKYDANGHLIRVADSDDETIAGVNARNMLVDTEGRILRKELKGNNTYSLLVNGEIVGTSSKDYASDTINQSYVNQSALSSSGPSIYITQLGDTLQSVAKAVWGDATLWYLIADANGIIADQFQEGSRILIPAREVAGGNRNDTLKPYNPGEIIGNTTPNMPMPAGPDGCGMVGSIVTVAVAIILAIATKGYTSPYLKVAIAAASATAGQYAAVAAGEQDKVNWKSVALSTITAGVMPGNFSIVNDPYVNAALNGMLRNVVTQGIGIAINLQQDFSWTSLAAAGVGSAVGQRVGEEFGKSENIVGIDKDVREITQRTMVGFATGVTANLVSGGKMHAGRVLVDAFGNALGESLAQSNLSKARIAADQMRSGMEEAAFEKGAWRTMPQAVGNSDYAVPDGRSWMPLSSQATNDFLDTPMGQEWARTGGKIGYGLSDPLNRDTGTGENGTLVEGNDTTTLYQPGMQTVPISHKKMSLEEMAQYDEEMEAAHQAKIAQDNSRAYSMSKWEGFLTFNPVGRTINGASKAAYNLVKLPVNLVQGTGTLVQDAYGYSKQAIFGPDRGVMGDIRPYRVQNGIVRSFARRGAMETMGDFVYGVAKSAPGVGLIDSMYRRDYDSVGGEIFYLGTMYGAAKLGGTNIRGEGGGNSAAKISFEPSLNEVDRIIGAKSGAAIAENPISARSYQRLLDQGTDVRFVNDRFMSDAAEFEGRTNTVKVNLLQMMSAEDVASAIVHEATHQKRWFNGVKLGTQYEEYLAYKNEFIYQASRNPRSGDFSIRPTLAERQELWRKTQENYSHLPQGKNPFGGK